MDGLSDNPIVARVYSYSTEAKALEDKLIGSRDAGEKMSDKKRIARELRLADLEKRLIPSAVRVVQRIMDI